MKYYLYIRYIEIDCSCLGYRLLGTVYPKSLIDFSLQPS